VVYTDFIDELGTETTFDLPEVANGLDMARFKDKARQFLKAHEDHLALQRLRRGQALTPTDVVELERMLADAGGTPELIQKAAEDKFGLGIFIRSLVGMEREAVPHTQATLKGITVGVLRTDATSHPSEAGPSRWASSFPGSAH